MLVKRLFRDLLEGLGLSPRTTPASTGAHGSTERGVCGQCRHANHGTEDAAEGFWACPWIGGRAQASLCGIRYRSDGRWVYERFDGTNGTWGTGDPVFRSIPRGFEGLAVDPAAEEG